MANTLRILQKLRSVIGFMYPLPTLCIGYTNIQPLISLLPSNAVIFQTFHALKAWRIFRFPNLHEEGLLQRVQWFLEDRQVNASTAPDMLGLIFAILSLGTQAEASHLANIETQMLPTEESQRRADCYGRSFFQSRRNKTLISRQPQRVCKVSATLHS